MEKGFFGSLFDLSFTSFVTTKLVKVLYVLSLVILGIAYAVIAIAFFSSGGDSVTVGADGNLQSHSGGHTDLGLLWLFVFGPLFLFFYTLLYRVFFELVIVLFRIFENTRDQLTVTRAAWPEAAPPAPPSLSMDPPQAPV
ncbi:MAG TPA: DUF4282 domain-containing protein [Conexibacter sp.]|nr:DUF4282 domain-containing protein [Conexibacter sp.]